MTDPTRPMPKPTKSGLSSKKPKEEIPSEKISISPLSALDEYKVILLNAQTNGIKWVEVEAPLMDAALREISLAVGADMSSHTSFMQNDIRVYLKGSKADHDISENRETVY